jgi:NAD(P)-dependent dehydrogenase (short-subunit alcohol dehydrogenase family)
MSGTGLSGLAGRTMLVAGGYGGIGTLICQRLAARGAAVAVAGRSLDKAEELAGQLRGQEASAIGARVDLTSPQDVRLLIDNVQERLGVVDTVINCASRLATIAAVEFPPCEFREIIDTNLTGAFLLSTEVARRLIDRGESGCVVHLSSVRGASGSKRGFSAYGASKAGLDLLVRQLATEWGQHDITVNAVAPGFVATEFVATAAQDRGFMEMLRRRIPLGRFAEPQDVAGAVEYLVSPDARFITGQVIYVDGGVTASQ